MKHLLLFIFIISVSLNFTACTPESDSNNKSTSTDSEGGDGEDNTNDGVGNSGNGTGNQSAGNCTGTSSDGTGAGQPLAKFNLFLAGHQTWVPGSYSNPLQSDTMPTIRDASLFFQTDSKLVIRFKVNPQPYPTAGEEYCYGRETGQASDPYPYQKLRFRIYLRDVLCDTPNPSDPTQCDSGFYLGDKYAMQLIEPISVNSCSPKINIGALRNSSQYGTVIEVDDVKADSTCQANDTFCPAEKIVRRASCWHMTLQVATDFTQNFK